MALWCSVLCGSDKACFCIETCPDSDGLQWIFQGSLGTLWEINNNTFHSLNLFL